MFMIFFMNTLLCLSLAYLIVEPKLVFELGLFPKKKKPKLAFSLVKLKLFINNFHSLSQQGF